MQRRSSTPTNCYPATADIPDTADEPPLTGRERQVRALVGRGMAGASLTLVELDDEIEGLLEAPASIGLPNF